MKPLSQSDVFAFVSIDLPINVKMFRLKPVTNGKHFVFEIAALIEMALDKCLPLCLIRMAQALCFAA